MTFKTSFNKRTAETEHGITIWSLFGLLFVAFQLAGIIEWSWWWVLAPFWGAEVARAVLE